MADLRIYTDKRFPGVEVVNEGNTRFRVLTEEVETDAFGSLEHRGAATVSESFAARRARVYFERMAKSELRQLDEDFEDRDALGLPSDRDATFVNDPPPSPGVLTPDMLLDMWERAQAMPEGREKDALMAQVRSAAAQLESTAEEIVNRILDQAPTD